MSRIQIDVPDALYENVKEVAEQDHVSVEEFISSLIESKLSARRDQEYFATRAARGSLEKFDAIMRSVPDVEPPFPDQPFKR